MVNIQVGQPTMHKGLKRCEITNKGSLELQAEIAYPAVERATKVQPRVPKMLSSSRHLMYRSPTEGISTRSGQARRNNNHHVENPRTKHTVKL